jgi:DNA-binding NarL/FixJ family response regulator
MDSAPPPRRVLIVDNSADLAEALGMIVRLDDGLEFVGCALTGKEALEKAAAGEVDVMVLDLGLGDCSGFDVLDRLRERHSPVKVIMHTGHALQELQDRARAKGAAGFVLKDGDFRALLKAIHSV